jgi:hypothetical protein
MKKLTIILPEIAVGPTDDTIIYADPVTAGGAMRSVFITVRADFKDVGTAAIVRDAINDRAREIERVLARAIEQAALAKAKGKPS